MISRSNSAKDAAGERRRLLARVGGIVKEVSLAYVPEVKIGEYVIVHVGFALSRLDENEAKKVFQYLKEMDELTELKEGSP